jgi:hypothetical protein
MNKGFDTGIFLNQEFMTYAEKEKYTIRLIKTSSFPVNERGSTHDG